MIFLSITFFLFAKLLVSLISLIFHFWHQSGILYPIVNFHDFSIINLMRKIILFRSNNTSCFSISSFWNKHSWLLGQVFALWTYITKVRHIMAKKRPVLMVKPVDSKDSHQRTSSHYLTFVNPATCATGYLHTLIKNIFRILKDISKRLLSVAVNRRDLGVLHCPYVRQS